MLTLTREDPRDAGRQYSFAPGTVNIGRREGNDLVLDEGHISSRHAVIRHSGGRYMFADRGSTNGSLVLRGTRRLLLGPRGQPEVALEDGDLVLLGDIDQAVHLRVKIDGPLKREQTRGTIVATRVRAETREINLRLGADEQALPVLFRLVQEVNGLTRRDEILKRVASAVLEAIPGAVDVLVVLPEGGSLAVAAEAHRGEGVCRTPDETICRQVLDGDAALLFGQHDAAEVPAETLVSQGIGSGIAAPLWAGEAAAGVLQINCLAGVFELSARHLDLAVVLAHHAAAALERADLVSRLERAEKRAREENRLLRRRTQPDEEMVAEDPVSRQVQQELQAAAETEVTVLLTGETGSGKEVAARYVHRMSARGEGLMVPVNCGALSETLLDSELFGHRKGAFTGATTDRKGVFEVARGGTVFLDEIGETPASVQVRLLRVLEESKIKVLGESMERGVDARIIAATNRDLAARVEEGAFRQDLYYRLRVFPVRIPPLRERPGDIEPLLELFIQRFSLELGKRVDGHDPDLVALLRQYPFPGNVRELCNEVERAMVRAAPGQPLTPDLFSEDVQGKGAAAGLPLPPANTGGTLKAQLDQVERELIRRALGRVGGKRIAAATALGLTRQGLAKKIQRLGVEE